MWEWIKTARCEHKQEQESMMRVMLCTYKMWRIYACASFCVFMCVWVLACEEKRPVRWCHFIMASDSSAEVVLQQRRLDTMKRILQVHRYVTCSAFSQALTQQYSWLFGDNDEGSNGKSCMLQSCSFRLVKWTLTPPHARERWMWKACCLSRHVLVSMSHWCSEWHTTGEDSEVRGQGESIWLNETNTHRVNMYSTYSLLYKLQNKTFACDCWRHASLDELIAGFMGNAVQVLNLRAQ